MTKLFPGDRVRATSSHPYYSQIKDDEMVVVACELSNDMSQVTYQTATGTSKGFSNLPWENWKTGWREGDLEVIAVAETVKLPPSAKTVEKASEKAANKVA